MRIVAGKYRGIVLKGFEFENIRPTPDKVREAVFSKIQFDVMNSSWLDLFGGTGAVGLEALSRGAGNVVVCDDNSDSQKLIVGNYAKCKLKPNLIKNNYLKALKLLKENDNKFDFVYLDPPFATNYGVKAIKLIAEYDMLNEDGVVIYESLKDNKIDNIDEYYELIDVKYYGTIAVTYLQKRDSDV